jgi:hypothetical protein
MASRGKLEKWTLKLFGSPMTPAEFQERLGLVEDASSGKYMHTNYQLPCPPPPKMREMTKSVSEKWLKVLSLTGGFLLFMALYETFEYAFCFDDEKRKLYEEHAASRRATHDATTATAPSLHSGSGVGSATEFTRLLSDTSSEIPMETFSSSSSLHTTTIMASESSVVVLAENEVVDSGIAVDDISDCELVS